MDNTIKVDVQNNVNVQGASISQGTAMTGQTPGMNWSALSAQLFVGGARKLIGATGNSELASFIRKGGKYAFGMSRILASGGTDVAAIAGMALDIAGDALSKANEVARVLAKMQNDTDMARIKAGLLYLGDTDKITTNWWSGRYKYGRG